MTVLLSVLGVVAFIALVLLEAGRTPGSTVSVFELRRRKAAHDKKAGAMLRREELRAQAGALKAPLRAVLLVGLALVLLSLLGWRQGMAAAFVVALLYARIAQVGMVRVAADRLYRKYEGRLLDVIARHESKVKLLAGKRALGSDMAPLGSREELVRLLEVSSIFSDDDKKLLTSALSFNDKTVKDVMVKQADMVTVKPSELLGPLVLDDLHKTKHEIFPVVKDGDIVGLLDIRDHVALRRKESVYVRDVMQGGVVRIDQAEPLDEALRVLVASKQPYLIVTEDGQVTGLLGLGDVVRALTGWTRR